jgi:hypothetical protein
MKRSLYVALSLLVFLGCVHSAYPAAEFDFDAPGGTASAQVCNPIYNTADCPGIHQHFMNQPIPMGSVDVANGKTIVGYDIVCEGAIIMSVGGAGTETRDVHRTFGVIRVRYR